MLQQQMPMSLLMLALCVVDLPVVDVVDMSILLQMSPVAGAMPIGPCPPRPKNFSFLPLMGLFVEETSLPILGPVYQQADILHVEEYRVDAVAVLLLIFLHFHCYTHTHLCLLSPRHLSSLSLTHLSLSFRCELLLRRSMPSLQSLLFCSCLWA